jgi:hypothetical protein
MSSEPPPDQQQPTVTTEEELDIQAIVDLLRKHPALIVAVLTAARALNRKLGVAQANVIDDFLSELVDVEKENKGQE